MRLHEPNSNLSRPVFRTTGFEEIDETCSSGAFIGGLAGVYEDAGIAAAYKSAADLLVERALADDRVHEVVLPVLFLYRHVLELRLKFAVRPRQLNHDLVALVRELNQILVKKRGIGLSRPLIERVGEMGAYDTSADAFRFHAKRRKGVEGVQGAHFMEEVWVDLAHLRDVVHWIDRELLDAAVVARAVAPSSLPSP